MGPTGPSVAAGRAAAAGGGGLALLDLEGVAAAARGAHVRVVDLEPGLLEAVQEVDRRALQVRRAPGVDDDRHAVQLRLEVAVLDALVEAERVLEPGAAATLDGDTEDAGLALGLLGHQLLDLVG